MRFHGFIPVSGTLEITIGSANAAEAAPGQAFFMEKGPNHVFRNTGSATTVVMEIFVKDRATLAERDALRLATSDKVRQAVKTCGKTQLWAQ